MRKNNTCPKCGDGAIFDAAINDNNASVWKCRCCLGEMPRRTYTTKKAIANRLFLNQFFKNRNLE